MSGDGDGDKMKIFFEGQEVKAVYKRDVLYGNIYPLDEDEVWPNVFLIKCVEYPRGTYCGIKWIEEAT